MALNLYWADDNGLSCGNERYRQPERKNEPENTSASALPTAGWAGMLGLMRNGMTAETGSRRFPLWLIWSVTTILLWGAWGLVSKIASDGVDMYVNQLLYTVGLLPLMVFVGWTVWKRSPREEPKARRRGVFWAFLTGILGGLGNLAFFQALVKGGKASVVAPVTALFPMVTVLLAMLFLKERLGRVQWVGLGLAFVAIYLLSA
jgi:transporter family protein